MALEHVFVCTRLIARLRSGHLGELVDGFSFWLGHAETNTTHAYIEIDMEMKRKMLHKAAPLLLEESKQWHEPKIQKWLDDLTHAPGLCAVL